MKLLDYILNVMALVIFVSGALMITAGDEGPGLGFMLTAIFLRDMYGKL